eukprot:1716688-Pyramimonas_sp.AAC.1
MRTRLLKCSVEQVRLAARDEADGAELLDCSELANLRDELQRPNGRVGAVDVEGEGPPPPEAWDVTADVARPVSELPLATAEPSA